MRNRIRELHFDAVLSDLIYSFDPNEIEDVEKSLDFLNERFHATKDVFKQIDGFKKDGNVGSAIMNTITGEIHVVGRGTDSIIHEGLEWPIGIGAGHGTDLAQEMGKLARNVHESYGTKVSMTGHSHAGFSAELAARMVADIVTRVTNIQGPSVVDHVLDGVNTLAIIEYLAGGRLGHVLDLVGNGNRSPNGMLAPHPDTTRITSASDSLLGGLKIAQALLDQIGQIFYPPKDVAIGVQKHSSAEVRKWFDLMGDLNPDLLDPRMETFHASSQSDVFKNPKTLAQLEDLHSERFPSSTDEVEYSSDRIAFGQFGMERKTVTIDSDRNGQTVITTDINTQTGDFKRTIQTPDGKKHTRKGHIENQDHINNPDEHFSPPEYDYDKEGPQPILLDLDGDGIQITELDRSNVFIDATGDGLENRTAWAATGNAVLFYDPDGRNAITEMPQEILDFQFKTLDLQWEKHS